MPTFTFINGSTLTAKSWDTASNWSPAGVAYNSDSQTTYADSFVMGDIGLPTYTAYFADHANAYLDGYDQATDLTINYAGATLTQTYGGGVLKVANSISILAGTLDLGYGGEVSFLSGARSFLINGVLQGSGAVDNSDPALTGHGTIIALNEGGGVSLDLGSQIDSGLTLQINTGAIMAVSAVQAGVTITIENGSSGTLELNDPGHFHGTVAGLAVGTSANGNPGSFLTLSNVGLLPGDRQTLTSANIVNNVITLKYGTRVMGQVALVGDYHGDYVNWVPSTHLHGATDLFLTNNPVCYVAGTRILTADGAVPIENIAAGDMVATIAVADGKRAAQAVKWVGYRKITLDKHPNASELAPIRIRRGALGDGLPARDLLVSPPHCLLMDGKLVPAKLLVNGMTIVRDTLLKTVEYYHIELDRHAIILAEGVEAETYLDTGNRAFFTNAGLALMLHPEFHVNAGLRCWETDACAPLVVSPAAVRPFWQRLSDRAVSLGNTPPEHATTTDADIHLLADGRRIDAVSVDGQRHSFIVPPGNGAVELMSRSVTPSVLVPYLDDPRELGVAVRGLVVRHLSERAEYAADHPALLHGWHGPERQGTAIWRWTNGRGVLPVGEGPHGPLVVEVEVSETTTYLREFEIVAQPSRMALQR